MLSKALIKKIHALELRKFRRKEQLFVAEGPKLVEELCATLKPVYVGALPEWMEAHPHLTGRFPCDTLTPDELQRASLLKCPQQVLALFPIPQYQLDISLAESELLLALDGIQDPGNLGTIARVADWFGIGHIICSPDTADIYNPKAVQATMGALARVQFHYMELPEVLSKVSAPIYGTFLDGENLYRKLLSGHGVIVMGNEGKGISRTVGKMVSQRLLIPNYPMGSPTTESLNVAIATSIVCAEFRRRCQQP